MDRIARQINNRKQNKIRVSNSQPSVQSLREGEEVLYLNKDNKLWRYRKEKGVLWKSDMSHDGSHVVEKNLTVKKDLKFKGATISSKNTGTNLTISIDTQEAVGGNIMEWDSLPDASLKVYINGTLYQIPLKAV